MEKGEGGRNRFGAMLADDPNRTKKMAVILCCCVSVLAIIGIVLGVVVFKDDEPAPAPKASPTAAPVTPAPVTPPTVSPTISPTMPIPNEMNIAAAADTFIYLSDDAEQEGPFGDETSLLVQNGVGQAAAVSLMTFNMSDVPMISTLEGWLGKAVLVLTLFETDDSVLAENVTLDSMRLPANEADIEAFAANFSSIIEGDEGEEGPSFEVFPEVREILVDISSIVFGEEVVIRRRLASLDEQLFLALMNSGEEEVESVRFFSSESLFPPRVEIELTGPSPSPSISLAPSISPAPSSSPSLSNAPSVSMDPSSMPSATPSQNPSISPVPTESYNCTICSEGEITNPDAPLDLPLIGSTTCAALQQIGDNGAITAENCAMLQPIVKTACCLTESEPFFCNICSGGGNVTNPEVVVSIPQQPDNTCEGYQTLGDNGAIDEASCAGLQIIATSICCEVSI